MEIPYFFSPNGHAAARKISCVDLPTSDAFSNVVGTIVIATVEMRIELAFVDLLSWLSVC